MNIGGFHDIKLVNSITFEIIKIKLFVTHAKLLKSKIYSLVATINHSGNLNAGHYWAFVKDSDAWLECNDSSVLKVKSSALNNNLLLCAVLCSMLNILLNQIFLLRFF